MRKSFGGGYGGAGGGNGGDMLRRVVRTKLKNFQESLPSPNSSTTKNSSSSSPKRKNSSPKHALSISSKTPNNINGHPLSLPSPWPLYPNYVMINNGVSGNEDDDDNNGVSEVDSEWECLENYYDPIFGVVPSSHEVQHALYSLQQVFHPLSRSQSATEERSHDVDIDMDDQTKSSSDTLKRTSSKGSETDWIEPSMLPYDRKLIQSPGWGRVHDAFHLLQSEPSVQRMVVSLSSDKAVWDAVLNNEAVREIRDSYRDASESIPPSSVEKSDSSSENFKIFKWMFENVKMKLLEVLEDISQFLGELFKPIDCEIEGESYAFTEKLKSTFLITIVVLLTVVVARGHMA